MELRSTPGLALTRDHRTLRPGSVPGRTTLAFHLTMERAPGLRDAAASVAPILDAVGWLDVVPARWLHLTMTGIADEDAVTPAQLDAIADPVFARWADVREPRVRYRSVLMSPASLILTASEEPWLDDMLMTQRDAADGVLGPGERRAHRPHTALAYANAVADPRALLDALAPWAASLPEEIEVVPTLTLLRLRHEEHGYAWDVLRQA